MKIRSMLAATAAILALSVGSAMAQSMPKAVIGMSGWTGFSPLSLAEKAGLFKKHGVDVEVKFIPQKERHLALAAGSVQVIATTVDTQIAYAASGVELTQILLLDKSKGGDGLAVRGATNSLAELKGKQIAVDGAGTTPYFMFAYILKKNGLSPKDFTLNTLSPQAAATAFVAGQFDGAVTYEPYLSQIRAKPESGKILYTTIDYPVVVDTVSMQPKYIEANPAVAKGIVAGFFDALDMIAKEPDKSYEIMGSVVKQSGPDFAKSAAFIAWQDKAANKAYFADGMNQFLQEAAQIQLETGVIKQIPDLKKLVDTRFLD